MYDKPLGNERLIKMHGVIDLAGMHLRQLIADFDTTQRSREIRMEVMRRVNTQLASDGVPVLEGVLPAQRAQHCLAKFHEAAQMVAAKLVAGRSNVEWLWYLRRVPQLFDFNRLRGTRTYCAAIAEQLCASSPTKGAISATGRYPIGILEVHDLVHLRESVWLINAVHVAIRWAGKGSDIRFSILDAPGPESTEELADAVRLYDERRDRAPSSTIARLGLTLSTHDSSKGVDEASIPGVFPLERRQMLPIPGNHGYHSPT